MTELAAAVQREFPRPRVVIKRIVIDGDHVVVHLEGLLSQDRPVDAVMEIYRFEGGRIAEHWEVVATVPVDHPNPQPAF